MADIRSPTVAGMFYPADAETLLATIRQYLEQADPPEISPVHAIIVPHAGYIYSGPVAAFAYRLLQSQPSLPGRIFLLGPSHRAWFPGVAIADVDGFATPLGIQPVDRAFARALASTHREFSAINSPHIPEHCLEVQIPFIYTFAPDAPIVPMLFGETNPARIAELIEASLQPDDLIIVSSDLSHYHSNEQAHRLDSHFVQAVLEGDARTVATGEACGQAPILTLMKIAQSRGWRPNLLDYHTSGDIAGDTSQVVGYAAIAYTEGG